MNLLILVSIWFPVCFHALSILGYFLYSSLTSNKSTPTSPEEDDHSAIQEVENILGETVVKNPGEAFVIGSDGIDTVTANAVPITMRKHYQMYRRTKNIEMQGLEEEIYVFLHRGECRVFKNDDQERDEPKRTFNECAQTRKHLQKINDLMIQAANAGIFIFHAIFMIMSLMSPDKEKELGAKAHAFEETMTLVNTGEFSAAVSRILDTLQEAKIQLRRRKDHMKEELIIAARNNLIIERDDGDCLTRSFFDEVIFKLLNYTFKLELFCVRKRLPSVEILPTAELQSLEGELGRYGFVLSELELKIESLMEQGWSDASVSMNWKQSLSKNAYYQEMRS